MASYERKTNGLLRIIQSDGSFRNQMIYNRAAKSIGNIKLTDEYFLDNSKEYIDKDKLPELIDKINFLLVDDYAFMHQSKSYSQYGIRNLMSPYVYCYSEADLLALKLGLKHGRD